MGGGRYIKGSCATQNKDFMSCKAANGDPRNALSTRPPTKVESDSPVRNRTRKKLIPSSFTFAEACIRQGQVVIRCVQSILSKVDSACPKELTKYAVCLDKEANKFQVCGTERNKNLSHMNHGHMKRPPSRICTCNFKHIADEHIFPHTLVA